LLLLRPSPPTRCMRCVPLHHLSCHAVVAHRITLCCHGCCPACSAAFVVKAKLPGIVASGWLNARHVPLCTAARPLHCGRCWVAVCRRVRASRCMMTASVPAAGTTRHYDPSLEVPVYHPLSRVVRNRIASMPRIRRVPKSKWRKWQLHYVYRLSNTDGHKKRHRLVSGWAQAPGDQRCWCQWAQTRVPAPATLAAGARSRSHWHLQTGGLQQCCQHPCPPPSTAPTWWGPASAETSVSTVPRQTTSRHCWTRSC